MTTAGITAVAGAFGLMLQAVCLLKNAKCAGNYLWATLAAGGECRNVDGEKIPCYIFAARVGNKEWIYKDILVLSSTTFSHTAKYMIL